MNHVPTTATSADLPQVADLFARVFHGTTPGEWLVSDPVERLVALRAHFELAVEHGLEHGAIHLVTADDGTLTAAAVWVRHEQPDRPPPPPRDYEERLARGCGVHTPRFLVYDELLDDLHPRGRPHHFLAVLGVTPEHRNQGIGRGLVGHYHALLADGPGTPTFLIASSPDSARLYRRLGYADGPTLARALPDGGPESYPMWREPDLPDAR
ncbi:GNAT family N-acetyltransferase [Actinosynnema sp. CS-041913]|uniref:GNAT family N-acetyltransferase n=1 Tax=Actinosynnema sp. CS-041913 TaxID=3239917 RepID=UPI003D94C8F7